MTLNWESAYGKAYKLQASDDTKSWRDIFSTDNGGGGTEHLSFAPVTTRYVRLLGVRRATGFGYSLYSFEVYGKTHSDLSPVQFIRLLLTDEKGVPVADNFYWRSDKGNDYTALNNLPAATLRVTSRLVHKGGGAGIAQVTAIATVTVLAVRPPISRLVLAARPMGPSRPTDDRTSRTPHPGPTRRRSVGWIQCGSGC